MPFTEELRMAADELRAVATAGLSWSGDNPYDVDRYEHVLRVAARIFSFADNRSAEEIERTVFRELTHIAPVPVADAAIFDNADRILLIRRADDGLWAMPGGLLDVGETPAEGAAREALEEAGAKIEVTDLIGVYDSRLSGTTSSLQLYHFVFRAKLVERRPEWATTPHEVTGVEWFAGDELPSLSPGHTVRIPEAFDFHRRDATTRFDRPT